jgi:hypothetical protein
MAAALCLLLTHPIVAQTFVISADPADAQINQTAAGDAGLNATISGTTGTTVQIGRASSTATGLFVMPFLLPVLEPGESVSSASFTFRQNGSVTNLSANVDLYGLGFRSESTVLVSDAFLGSEDLTDASKIQDILVPAGGSYSSGTVFSLSGEGATALAAYLNTQYSNGAGGNYVFLRLNSDIFTTGNRLEVNTSDSTTPSFRPSLTFTVIPEPASALLALAGLACTGWYRPRK